MLLGSLSTAAHLVPQGTAQSPEGAGGQPSAPHRAPQEHPTMHSTEHPNAHPTEHRHPAGTGPQWQLKQQMHLSEWLPSPTEHGHSTHLATCSEAARGPLSRSPHSALQPGQVVPGAAGTWDAEGAAWSWRAQRTLVQGTMGTVAVSTPGGGWAEGSRHGVLRL